jgi:hypothetical protein
LLRVKRATFFYFVRTGGKLTGDVMIDEQIVAVFHGELKEILAAEL